MSGKKLGLDNLYKNLYTTVNKNSPSGLSKAEQKINNRLGMPKDAKPSKYLPRSIYLRAGNSNTIKNIAKNAFKRSPIGRIADLTIKVGSGIGIGYNMAKEKLKTDKKSTGGETKLSPKQQKIAAAAPPPNKITGADFAALKKKS
jgi:hypothetical protein